MSLMQHSQIILLLEGMMPAQIMLLLPLDEEGEIKANDADKVISGLP